MNQKNQSNLSLNNKLTKYGTHRLKDGGLSIEFQVNRDLVFIHLSASNNQDVTHTDIKKNAKSLLGVSIDTLKEIANKDAEKGHPAYVWDCQIEIPTEKILKLSGKEKIR